MNRRARDLRPARWPRWLSIGAAAVLAALIVAGCGVPLQADPQALPADVIPPARPTPTPTEVTPEPSPSVETSGATSVSATPAPASLRLWFVQDDGLAASDSGLAVGTPPGEVLEALAIGPTAVEIAGGLRTVARDPLTGMSLVSVVPTVTEEAVPTSGPPATGPPSPEPSEFNNVTASVTVQLSSAFSALPPAEQVLLLGQVVLSLAGAGERAVAFVDDAGRPVAVPLPDGRLLDVPASARDYSGLIVRP